jgi:hypothetical protein
MDLQKLQLEIEELNRAKGWYEGVAAGDPIVDDAKEALIHSELAEATECIRKGRLGLDFENESGAHYAYDMGKGSYHKPCGLASELADVVIRILDAMSLRGEQTSKEESPERGPYQGPDLSPLGMAAHINGLHKLLADEGPTDDLLDETYRVAWLFRLDLDAAIAVKHAYNATRPHRHGGKTL